MRIGRKQVPDNARIVTKMTRVSHFWRIAHMGTVKKCAYKHNNAQTNVVRIWGVTYALKVCVITNMVRLLLWGGYA